MELDLKKSVAWMRLVESGLSGNAAERMIERADSNGQAISASVYVFRTPEGNFDLNWKLR